MAAEKNAEGRYETEIDNKTYSFEKWGADDSLTTMLKIAGMIGKPIGLFMASFSNDPDKGLLDKDIKSDMLALAFEALAANLDEHKALSLMKKLAGDRVMCDGVKITFNAHYEDRLDVMFKVAYANLEVQYGSFFGALRTFLPKAEAKKGVVNRKT